MKNELCLFSKVYSSFLLIIDLFKFYNLHIVHFHGLQESVLEVVGNPVFVAAALVLASSLFVEVVESDSESFTETLLPIGVAYALASYTVESQYKFMVMTKLTIVMTIMSLLCLCTLFIIIGLLTESEARMKHIVTIMLASVAFYVSMLNLSFHFPVTGDISQYVISGLGFLISYGIVRTSNMFSNDDCPVKA